MALILSQGKLTQAQLEDFQSDALAIYEAKEPQGKIISILPNDDASVLVITADSVQAGTAKAFKKKFGKKRSASNATYGNSGYNHSIPIAIKTN